MAYYKTNLCIPHQYMKISVYFQELVTKIRQTPRHSVTALDRRVTQKYESIAQGKRIKNS